MADAATSPSALRAGWPSCRACCSPCLRLPELGLEADAHRRTVQAGTTGRLLDEGFAYRYDPVEYHGPTLYYFTVPLAHLRGRDGFRQLDETTLRLVPALFGAGLLLWLPLFRGVLGFRASPSPRSCSRPVFTYYSRYYIQEMLTSSSSPWGWPRAWPGCALAGGGCAGRWSPTADAGMMHATKETCVLTFGAMAGAGVVAAGRAARSGSRPTGNEGSSISP
ncbi:MAG: hypothetical protein U1F87_15805 [Kiritimatiellia bacterium]